MKSIVHPIHRSLVAFPLIHCIPYSSSIWPPYCRRDEKRFQMLIPELTLIFIWEISHVTSFVERQARKSQKRVGSRGQPNCGTAQDSLGFVPNGQQEPLMGLSPVREHLLEQSIPIYASSPHKCSYSDNMSIHKLGCGYRQLSTWSGPRGGWT